MQVKKNFPLKRFTTMAIGGPARFFVVVETENELAAVIQSAKAAKLRWVVVGDGSNLIAADKGCKGVVIQNRIQQFNLSSSSSLRQGRRVMLGAGNNLLKTIFILDRLGLAGMEKMAGIPGTVGGALYGCAGAYGQEIKDHIKRVRIFDGKQMRWITKAQCKFEYRGSIFKKKKNWIIVAAEFAFRHRAKGLSGVSNGIIRLRAKKYPPGLRCPGSFFKNIKIADLRPAHTRRKFLSLTGHERITYGKVPVGKLLEEVGAKGMRRGRIAVAAHHANLIFNPGRGTARDVKRLAHRLQGLVKKKFGITIQEEVQFLP